jgi:hypothetical protein
MEKEISTVFLKTIILELNSIGNVIVMKDSITIQNVGMKSGFYVDVGQNG